MTSCFSKQNWSDFMEIQVTSCAITRLHLPELHLCQLSSYSPENRCNHSWQHPRWRFLNMSVWTIGYKCEKSHPLFKSFLWTPSPFTVSKSHCICLSTWRRFQSTVSQIQSTFSLRECLNFWKSIPRFNCYFTDAMQSVLNEQSHRAPASLKLCI